MTRRHRLVNGHQINSLLKPAPLIKSAAVSVVITAIVPCVLMIIAMLIAIVVTLMVTRPRDDAGR